MPEITDNLPQGFRLISARQEYRIEKMLGRGGFGVTYLASYPITDGNIKARVSVCIKEHFPMAFAERKGSEIIPMGSNAEMYRRSLADFKAEAERLYKLGSQHPNIVGVNEVFAANGTAYYVMEYIEGESLLDFVKACGPLPEQKALNILSPVIDAIGFLHTNRINHLDIKPENIMMHAEQEDNEQYTPVLIDFGLSIHYDAQGNKTRTRGTLGASDGYSPLEQYAGISTFSPATDVYALAASLLHLLTGKQPAAAGQLRVSDVKQELEQLGISKQVTDAIVHALMVDLDQRTPDIATFTRELGLPEKSHSHSFVINPSELKKQQATRLIASKKTKKEAFVSDVSGSPNEKKSSKRFIYIICGAVLLIAAGLTIAMLSGRNKAETFIDSETATEESVVPVIPQEESSMDIPQAEDVQEKKPSLKKDNGKTGLGESQHEVDEPVLQPKNTVTTISWQGGSYHGAVNNGRPNGNGRLTYQSARTISGIAVSAGCYMEGDWDNGSVVRGTIYDAEGNLLGKY